MTLLYNRNSAETIIKNY